MHITEKLGLTKVRNMTKNNKNKGKINILLIAAMIGIVIISFLGCINKDKQSSKREKITITDMAGRTVEVPAGADRIVCFGPGTLRLITYLQATDKVVGIEGGFEKESPSGRPYRLAHPELTDLSIIGSAGPSFVPNHEATISVKPDVIFVTYIEPRMADDLQEKTGVPVVVLSYGQLATFDNEDVFNSLKTSGKIINKEDRAEEVIQFIKNISNDLNDRTKDIADEKKKTVYVGGLGYKGHHGITSTEAGYPPFKSLNAKNVVDELNSDGHVFVDKEKILDWNPDILFIDGGGHKLVMDEYYETPEFFNSLKAVQNEEVYGLLPYNFYTTNIDTALADAYYIGKIIYPDEFKDIDPEKKANEIYTFLDGKPVLEEMKNDFEGFKKIDFKQ